MLKNKTIYLMIVAGSLTMIWATHSSMATARPELKNQNDTRGWVPVNSSLEISLNNLETNIFNLRASINSQFDDLTAERKQIWQEANIELDLKLDLAKQKLAVLENSTGQAWMYNRDKTEEALTDLAKTYIEIKVEFYDTLGLGQNTEVVMENDARKRTIKQLDNDYAIIIGRVAGLKERVDSQKEQMAEEKTVQWEESRLALEVAEKEASQDLLQLKNADKEAWFEQYQETRIAIEKLNEVYKKVQAQFLTGIS